MAQSFFQSPLIYVSVLPLLWRFSVILCVLPLNESPLCTFQSSDGGMLLCFQTTWRTGGRWCWRTNLFGPSAPARRPRLNRWRWLTASTFTANSSDATRSVNQRRMTHVVLFIVAAWCVYCDGGDVFRVSTSTPADPVPPVWTHLRLHIQLQGVCRFFKRLKMS